MPIGHAGPAGGSRHVWVSGREHGPTLEVEDIKADHLDRLRFEAAWSWLHFNDGQMQAAALQTRVREGAEGYYVRPTMDYFLTHQRQMVDKFRTLVRKSKNFLKSSDRKVDTVNMLTGLAKLVAWRKAARLEHPQTPWVDANPVQKGGATNSLVDFLIKHD